MSSDRQEIAPDASASQKASGMGAEVASRRETRIHWARIAAEGVAILTSILLAFAIDAWWERRSLAREEDGILVGLLADFERSRAHATVVATSLHAVADAARGLLSTTGPTPTLSPDAVALLLGELLGAGVTYVPIEGTLTSLLGSDGLGLISNPELRQKLAEWPHFTAAVRETEARRAALIDSELMPYLHTRVPVRTLDMLADPSLDTGVSRFGIDTSTLTTDLQFENLVNEMLFNVRIAILRIADASAIEDAILIALRAEIGTGQGPEPVGGDVSYLWATNGRHRLTMWLPPPGAAPEYTAPKAFGHVSKVG